MMELARFMVDSLFLWKSRWRWTKYWQKTGGLGIQVVGNIFEGTIFLNSIALLKMDRLQLTAVHCHRRRCKYHISVDVFPRCKSVHMMATGKGDDQLIQYENMLELRTSYKLKIGTKLGHWPWMRGDNARRGHQWQHVHNCPWLRGDTARCVHQWQHDHFHRVPQCLRVSAHCLVLSCLYIVKRTRTVAQEMSLSHHRHVHVHLSVSRLLLLSLLTSRISCHTPSTSSCTWRS